MRRRSPTAPDLVVAAERRQQAVALRKTGATQEQIAKSLGVTHQAVSKMIRKELARLDGLAEGDALIVRRLELERLDALLLGLWRKAQQGHEGAVDRVLRIMERRAKYLGLDAPSKTDLGGTLGLSDVREMSRAQLMAIAAQGVKGEGES